MKSKMTRKPHLIKQPRFRFRTWTWIIIVFSFCIFLSPVPVDGKGGATRGAGGSGGVCLECLGNYTAEEMQEALFVLLIIMSFFVAVCSCQMYQRARWEFTGNMGKRPMPMAPYDRDIMIV